MNMMRWLFLFASMTTICQGRNLPKMEDKLRNVPTSGSTLWQPSDGRSREEWMKCHGQPTDDCQRTRLKLAQLRRYFSGDQTYSSAHVASDLPVDDSQASSPEAAGGTLDGCIWLTEDQIESLMGQVNNETDSSPSSVPDTHSRQRRTVVNFRNSPFSKWPMPIKYKFDGSHSIYDMATIRDAFSHWANNTCVRFQEIPTSQSVNDNHLLITSASTGCHSYIGRVRYVPQQINLMSGCISRFGTPVHEIGHSLGLWHEQSRSDRDGSIVVNWQNVYAQYHAQFYTAPTDNLVQYNYGSVMHYGPRDGSSANGRDTMTATNPLYQRNMGQRTGLSFENIKTINLAYNCAEKCVGVALERPCQHGGYQNPNDCQRCHCPDGFAGQFCDQVAPPTYYADCGGVVNLKSGDSYDIKSPGYDKRYYLSYQGCSWWIKAPKDHVIQLKFVDEFGVYCQYSTCFHWVEVKYKTDLGLEGPRFCCYDLPSSIVTSESEEMMVIFKSNYSNDYLSTQRGFHAVITAVARTPSVNSASETSVSSTTRASSTTTTSSPTSPVTSAPTTLPVTTQSSTNCVKKDVVLMLDTSSSVTQNAWTGLTTFVGRLITDLKRRGGAGRIAVVSYADNAEVALPLGEQDPRDVTSLPLPVGRERNIANALQLARSLISDVSTTSCLLVTTGTATVARERTLSEAAAARSEGVDVVVLGVGPDVNGTEVAGVASAGDSGVVYADNYAQLTETSPANFGYLQNRLTDKLCGSLKSFNGQPQQLWSCSFDDDVNNRFCDMRQESSRDQFDWTVWSGPTPSEPTGPDFAYDGQYYAYIEASNPRRPRDEAWLYIPKLSYSGVVCVDFHYHMHGFHINRLRILQTLDQSAFATVWMRSRDMGNTWFHGKAQVDITADSQILFAATRGDEFSGDIAIDAIKVYSGVCR